MKFYAILSLFIMFSCTGSKKYSCNEVSIRLSYSLVNRDVENLIILYKNNGVYNEVLNKELNYLIDLNNTLVVYMGGFKEGKNLEIVDPCKSVTKGVVNLKEIHNHYLNLIEELKSIKVINEGVYNNLKFIIESYYCNENCIYDVNKELNSSAGDFLLNNLTLQYIIIDILFSQT